MARSRVDTLAPLNLKQEDSIIEASVVALVGGEFKFPENTVLVSAVYSVSVSKPLLNSLTLEIQHCVDLRGQPGLSQYLKFAIAPADTPSLPYQFRIIEGGEFSSNSRYGSIQRKEFCLVCILGEETIKGIPLAPTDGDLEEGQEEQQQGQKDQSATDGYPFTVSTSVSTTPLNEAKNKSEVVTKITKPNKSSGIKEAIVYTVLVYYEEKGVEDLVTFTVAKDLIPLIDFINHRHSNAKIGPQVNFHFGLDNEYIELKFDSPQEEPFTGWTIKPHTKPCRFYQDDVNRFGEVANYPRPPSCLVSVYGSPGAVPSLHYAVPLVGVADPVTLYIHRSLRTTPPLLPPSTIPSTSYSSSTAKHVVPEETAGRSTGRPEEEIKAEIDADSSSFIEKQTEWINDNLDCLSDVQVAEKKLFLVQGDKPQFMNWERFSLRIGVEKESLSSSDTVEVHVAALVGGQFKFPENTVLISAVYAVTVSKPLLKPLTLEMQHCVDLTGRPGLSKYLKFAIAPVSTPSLPYQFRIIEGGEFNSDCRYGSIQRKEFSLVCILGLIIARIIGTLTGTGGLGRGGSRPRPGGGGGGGRAETGQMQQQHGVEQQQQDGEQQGEEVQQQQGGERQGEGVQQQQEGGLLIQLQGGQQQQQGEELQQQHEGMEQLLDPISCTDKSPNNYSSNVVFSSIKEHMTYTGLVYYEEKRMEDHVIFTATRDLNALLQYFEKKHHQAENGPTLHFEFKEAANAIELIFNDQSQAEPFDGWSIKPQTKPCRLRRNDIDNFGDANPIPPLCLIIVYGAPNAVPMLDYSVALEGVGAEASSKAFSIHRTLRVQNSSTSSSSVPEAIAPSPTNTVDKVKKVIKDVLTSNNALLNDLSEEALPALASQLISVGLITKPVKDKPSIDKFIDEFCATIACQKKLPKIQDWCQKFLNSFIAVGGSYAATARVVHEEWIEKSDSSNFNIEIDT